MSDIRIATAEDQILLEKEAKYCSYGDTVHYLEPAKLFAGCNGSFLYDYEDKPYLDLQMWYSAVNFGYANPRLNNALKQQIDTLPQLPGHVILVSNEVGWGIVPMHPVSRLFADEQGRLNQRVAAVCDQVTLVAAGLPVTLKAPLASA